MKRKKCFADGGLTEDETAGLDTGYRQGAEAPAGTGEDERPAPTGMSEATKFAEPATFGAAFKAARASGAKTFEFKGKKYTTELASTKPKAKSIGQTDTPKRSIAGADGLPSTSKAKKSAISEVEPKQKVLGPASEQKFLGSGYAGGGKVRGAGKASKGVRAAKCC